MTTAAASTPSATSPRRPVQRHPRAALAARRTTQLAQVTATRRAPAAATGSTPAYRATRAALRRGHGASR